MSVVPGARRVFYVVEDRLAGLPKQAQDLFERLAAPEDQRVVLELWRSVRRLARERDELLAELEVKQRRSYRQGPGNPRIRKIPRAFWRIYDRAISHRGRLEIEDVWGHWAIGDCPRDPADAIRRIAKRYEAAPITVLQKLQRRRAKSNRAETYGGLFKVSALDELKAKQPSLPKTI